MNPYFPKGGNSNKWSNELKIGSEQAANIGKNRVAQANYNLQRQADYQKALETQALHERENEKRNYEMAKDTLNQLSVRFPKGDPKSDRDYANWRLQAPEQYRAIMQHIKEGMPWAVQDGEISRVPRWDAVRHQQEALKSSLEEKIQSGNATQEEKVQWAQTHFHLEALKKATDIVNQNIKSGTDGYKDLSEADQADKIAQVQNMLMNAAVSSAGNRGLIPGNQGPEGDRQINPYLQGLVNNSSGATPVGAVANLVTPQAPQPVEQGVAPVQANQQQPDPLALAQQILAQRRR